MKLVQGPYIGFVDADDWIEPEMFERLYGLINKYDADIVQVGYWKEYIGRSSAKSNIHKLSFIDGETAMLMMTYEKLPNYLWNKLHKREIITCEFPMGRNFEDIYVYGIWLRNVKKMVLDPSPLYHYRMRGTSIVHSNSTINRLNYFASCIDRITMLEEYLKGSMNLNKKYAFINKSAVFACKRIARDEKDKKQRDDSIRHICRKLNEYPLPPIKELSLKVWCRAKILRTHPGFFSKLMRFNRKFGFASLYKKKLLFE